MSPSDAAPRPRLPRVDMHYRVELDGVPRRIDLPFVTGVLADLAGQPALPLPLVGDRSFVEVDSEHFDAFMAEVAPRLAVRVPFHLLGRDELAVELAFKRLDDFAPDAIVRGVPALAQALEAAGPAGPADADLVARVGAQLDAILHHPAFNKLEAAWRSLHRMVQANEPDGLCPIRVMVITKTELAKALARYKGAAWDQSPIFKRIYSDGHGSPGGQPFGCIVLDFAFDHGSADVEVLGELAKIAAACQAPLLAAAAPSLMQMESWLEIGNPRDITKIFTTPEYAAWRALRDSDDSRSLALVMPRYLERAPWRDVRLGGAGLRFDESVGAGWLWANPAYLLATVIQRSFRIHGWFSDIVGLASGGAVEGLAQASPPAEGEPASTVGPVEARLDDRRLDELARNGLVALVARGRSNIATFMRAPMLCKPAEYDDPDATANARLGAQLSYQLIVGRFAHFVKAIVRDALGAGQGRLEAEAILRAWIADYAEPPAAAPNAFGGAPRPLAAAEVVVEDDPGQPGHFRAKFYIRPRGTPGPA